MENFNDILGSVQVASQNKMSGLVNIIGANDSDIVSSISTKQHGNLSTTLNVFSNTAIEENGKIANQIKSSLHVLNRSDLISSISIKPNNRMSIIIDVIQPPGLKTKINNVKDALIRDSIQTLNYGSDMNTLIGSKNGEQFKTLIHVDVNSIPKNHIVREAKLKLYKNNLNSQAGKIDVYRVDNEWSELGVTWKNQPPISNLVSSTVVPKGMGYIEFDILDAVKEWHLNPESNKGLMFVGSSSTSNDTFFFATSSSGEAYQFNTSDSTMNQPTLEVESYDETATYSFGMHEIPGSISSRQAKNNDLVSSLFVDSDWAVNNLPSTLTVHINFADKDLPSNFSIRESRIEDLPSSLTVFIHTGDSDLNSSVSVRRKVTKNLPSSLTVPIYNGTEELDSSILVRKTTSNNIHSSLTVFAYEDQNDLPSNLYVRAKSENDLISTIEIFAYVTDDDLQSTLTVRQKQDSDLPSSGYVLFRDDLSGSMKVYKNDDLESSIKVINGNLSSSLSVQLQEESDLQSSIVIKALNISELETTLQVYKNQDLTTTITIRKGYAYAFIM